MVSGRRHTAVIGLVDDLRRSETLPQEIHVCPECGGKLHIRFQTYSRGGKTLLGVQAHCENCGLAIAIDSAGPLPPWVQGLKPEP